MRRLFADPHDEAEQQALARQRALYAPFAESVAALAQSIREGRRDPAIFEKFQKARSAIDPRIMFEIGPHPEGGMYLALTPEVDRFLRPLVDEVIAALPQFDDWRFVAYRPRLPAAEAVKLVGARMGKAPLAHGVTLAAAEGKIDVTFHFPKQIFGSKADRKEAFILTECLLGEQDLDRWVGAIEAVDRRDSGTPFDRVAAEFDRIKEGFLAQLPAEPRWRLDPEGPRVLISQPNAVAQEGDLDRTDLVVYSADTWLGPAPLSPERFDGARYSRCGEVFVYLQLATDGPSTEGIQRRSDLEEALDTALRREQLGAVVGGGSGIAHDSIDFALVNLNPAIDLIREVARSRGVPDKSWILFTEAKLRAEWLSIHPGAPAPQGRLEG